MQMHLLSSPMQVHIFSAMKDAQAAKPDICPHVARAWMGLVRAEQAILAAVEADLRSADLPPLIWYDVLLELDRAETGRLSPGELAERMLLSQCNTSRLIDRMAEEKLLRRIAHPEDRRRQWIEIAPAGRALRKRIWPAYRAAILRHVGAKLSSAEAAKLAELLGKLM